MCLIHLKCLWDTKWGGAKSYFCPCAGIRSVSFYEHIVTVGTGQGSLLFYDIRAQRFLEDPLNPAGGYRQRPGEGTLKLTTGKGWLVRIGPSFEWTHVHNIISLLY